jgi:hypothetical protein
MKLSRDDTDLSRGEFFSLVIVNETAVTQHLMWTLPSPARARRACPLPGQGQGEGSGRAGGGGEGQCKARECGFKRSHIK